MLNKYKYKNAFKKQSIQTPQTKWLVSESEKKILSVINKKNSLITNFVNINKVNDFISSNKINTINNSNFLWQWLSFEYWYKNFLIKEKLFLFYWDFSY